MVAWRTCCLPPSTPRISRKGNVTEVSGGSVPVRQTVVETAYSETTQVSHVSPTSGSPAHPPLVLVLNRWVGVARSLLVPVIHVAQEDGEYVISVNRQDGYFASLLALWKARYPSKRMATSAIADGLKIIGDFSRQFLSHRLQYSLPP